MESFSYKFPRMQPDAVYTSVITKDGDLTLPEECLSNKPISEDDSFVLTNSLEDGIICLYSMQDFDDIRKNLDKLNSMDLNARRLKRRVVGEAVTVRINGRVINVLSEYLVKLGFDPNQEARNNQTDFPVMLLKYLNRIEITSSAVYETIIEELQNQQQDE